MTEEKLTPDKWKAKLIAYIDSQIAEIDKQQTKEEADNIQRGYFARLRELKVARKAILELKLP